MSKQHFWFHCDVGRIKRIGYDEQIFDTGSSRLFLPYDDGLRCGLNSSNSQATIFVGVAGVMILAHLVVTLVYFVVDGHEHCLGIETYWQDQSSVTTDDLPILIPPFDFIERGFYFEGHNHPTKTDDGIIVVKKEATNGDL